ncbi:unnamed protein product [Rotaria sordida]|uniref:LisH domain-containing protein n=3 Tax=Rotaria sordida TaxID=392033 RepID=A0A818LHJ8_9BILA|nr:unnamed protein product [Rotaria sordida]CAF3526641.1 unnamed protein product [Rotaria sordida]CAF3577809.1 unnamed protein product [Rotaria sordida]
MAEANLNYQIIKTTHAAREADDQRIENRKKNLIILILQWLVDEGYIESARQLECETNLDVSKYDVCDNIDLYTIIQEYESYFYVKFNRYPKLTKKHGPSTAAFMNKISSKISNAQPSNRRPQIPPIPRIISNGTESSTSPLNRLPSAGEALRRNASTGRVNQSNSDKFSAHSTPPSGLQRQSSTQPSVNNSNNHSTNSLEEMNLSFMKVLPVKSSANEQQQQQQQNGNKKKNTIVDSRPILNDTMRVNVADSIDPTDRLLKPLGGYIGYSSEWRELAQVISRVSQTR